MVIILGLGLLVMGITTFVISIQILFESKQKWQYNHNITKNINNNVAVDDADIKQLFAIDTRNDELVMYPQLSHKNINL